MILSRKHRLIFIKGYKVGGTSIEIALSRLCGPDDIVTPLLDVDERRRAAEGGSSRNYSRYPRVERAYAKWLAETAPGAPGNAPLHPPPQLFYNHMPLAEVAVLVPDEIRDFRIVCAERSPYAKVISWLNMMLSLVAYRAGGAMRAELTRLPAQFDRALEAGLLDRVRNIDLYRWPDRTLDIEVLRHERLASDFAVLLSSIGISAHIPLPRAKEGIRADDIDPRDVLRDDQLRVIDRIFEEEFAYFDYPRLA